MKRVAILGSTGSIGTQTIDVIESSGGDFEVVALSSMGNNPHRLLEQIERLSPRIVAVYDEDAAGYVRDRVGRDVEILAGEDGNTLLVEKSDADIVVAAIVGTRGVYPVLRALELGKKVALANKEALVVAGRFVEEAAKKGGGEIIPVDSEHSAIFQALQAGRREDVKRIVLTASGGPFRNRKDLSGITVEEALKHPTWQMGKKITIDSATLFNKGLEVIEARWLFDMPPEKIDVVIHPQSIVHSMVEFVDGSIVAQLGPPDMRIPISYALYYPSRWRNEGNDFTLAGRTLEFFEPDHERFPALMLAYRALREGDLSCFIYSQSNEVAVESFLKGEIGFTTIPMVVERVMGMKDEFPPLRYDGIIEVEKAIRKKTKEVIKEFRKGE